MAYIEFNGIDKFYGSNQVLKGINLQVKKGEFVTLLGPSGCGKSTLLRCLSGLESISKGSIVLDGEEITNVEPKNRNIGMVFQQYSLFPNMTVEENLAFGLKLKKLPKEEIQKRVKESIEMVELDGKEKQYPTNLSGGQQQRVALARGIIMRPKVLLLDEPLSAIDAKLRKSLQASIRTIHKELGLTSIFVTHDQDEAMVMSDVIHLFHDGVIEQSGTPVEMYTNPISKFAASFIGHYNILTGREFSSMVNAPKLIDQDIAIRPETISISNTPIQNDDEYIFEGKIIENTSRGNVMRYKVDSNGVKINTDVLFRSFTLMETGSHVYLSVAKKNCIML